jgi:hypothetical protein
MELVVDLDRVTVVLGAPEDLEHVAVRVGAPADASASSAAAVHRLGDVLVAANVGRLAADGTALIRPDAVRFHAAGQVDASWEARFAVACASAAARDGTLRADVIWPT